MTGVWISPEVSAALAMVFFPRVDRHDAKNKKKFWTPSVLLMICGDMVPSVKFGTL